MSLLSSVRMHAKLTQASNKLQNNSYDVEKSVSKTVTWLQSNSQYLISPFLAANYNTYFDFTSPLVGANDVPSLVVPSMVKIKGTNNSVILSNDSSYGISSFPETTHLTNGSAFNPAEEFESADLGKAKVRLTLIQLTSVGADKQPVFRLDVAIDNSDFHSWYYIHGNMSSNDYTYAAFYSTTGPITLNSANNSCISHQWSQNATSWEKGGSKSNCIIASDSNVITHGSIRGNVLSKANVSTVSPGGRISGSICKEDPSCHPYSLPSLDSWESFCGESNKGDLTISANTALSVASNNPADSCWRDLTINTNTSLTLETANITYHFRNITFAAENSSALTFEDISPENYIALNVGAFSGNRINGINFNNQLNAPYQVRLNITDSDTLNIDGSSPFSADLTAPDSQINLSGNLNYYGGIKAKQIEISDGVTLNADEAIMGVGAISNMTFTLKNPGQSVTY